MFLLGNLGTGLSAGWGSSSKPTTPMGGTPRTGSPVNLGSPQHRPASWASQVMSLCTQLIYKLHILIFLEHIMLIDTKKYLLDDMKLVSFFCCVYQGIPQGSTSPMPGHTPVGTPHHQPKSPGENARADYSRSHFDSVGNKLGEACKELICCSYLVLYSNYISLWIFISGKTGKVRQPGDVFGDLLGSQGYEFASKKEACPRTINEMRKEEMVKDMDPDKLKVCAKYLYKFMFYDV